MKYLLHALYHLRLVPNSISDWYRVCCGHHHDEETDNSKPGSSEEGDAQSNDHGNKDGADVSDVDFIVLDDHVEGGKETRPTVAFNKLKKLFSKSVPPVIRVTGERPQAPFQNSITNQTRLTGQKYSGLCLITLVAMKGMLHAHGKLDWRHLISKVNIKHYIFCHRNFHLYPCECRPWHD
jgi:hypothetical protein